MQCSRTSERPSYLFPLPHFYPFQGCNGSMIANGFCNDETNNAGCYYDGGDCCGSCVLTHYCLDCKCLDPETNKHTVQNVLVGDGYCHDVTNKAECNFDGNDCCGFCINTEFCIECECHSNYNLSKYFHQIIYVF